MPTNHQFRLAARPNGLPKRSDWNETEEPVKEPSDGELLVKTRYISLDPAMRGWMREGKSYIAPVEIGQVMRAGTVGEVVSSKNPAFAVGDFVVGMLGVQEYAISSGKGITKVDPKLARLPLYLGALGMPGVTAYFGLLDICHPKAGETVVVSAASGAVGAVVGQIAKLKDCRVIGIAGGPEKCAYITNELGFDASIDYKSENVYQALQKHCPKGIDVYFDNVGGEILDAVLALIARFARISICGAISQYNNTGSFRGPANYMSLLVNHARMEGFVVTDYADRWGEALRELITWYAQGKLKSREDIVRGIGTFPETLLKLFSGENFGKLVIEVA